MKKLKVKNIESYLEGVDTFEKPNVELEQYQTPPRVAAEILCQMENEFGDISGLNIGDFGCGTGIFTIGCDMLGASFTTGIDFDGKALLQAQKNTEDMECNEKIDFMNMDICNMKFRKTKEFETVVMNPPFGTRKAGIDMIFLQKAIENCSGAIYSIHKSSTRDFIVKQCVKWDVKCEILKTFDFELPKIFKFQKMDKGFTEVDLIRVDTSKS